MTDRDAISERLDRLEAENAGLRARLDALTARGSGSTPVRPGPASEASESTPAGATSDTVGRDAAPVSRRDLLARAGAGAAAAGAAAIGASVASLAHAAPVLAASDDGRPIVIGSSYIDVRASTLLASSDPNLQWLVRLLGGLTAIQVQGEDIGIDASALKPDGTGVRGSHIFNPGAGVGVHGRSTSPNGTGVRGVGEKGGVGVNGVSTSGAGVAGKSTSGVGVDGASDSSIGVAGIALAPSGATIGVAGESDSSAGVGVRGHAANDALGVYGYSGGDAPPAGPVKTGVLGQADQDAASVGVRGVSSTGRGGVFAGKAAQVRLTPSSAATHPASGQAGDLFVDKANRLWLCKGGTRWKLLG